MISPRRLAIPLSVALLSAFSVAAIANAQAAPSVDIANFAFAQPDVTIQAGTAITWTNADGVQHTTTSADGLWDSGALNGGDTFSYTFNQPGDFAYQCDIHPNMQGVIHVQAS